MRFINSKHNFIGVTIIKKNTFEKILNDSFFCNKAIVGLHYTLLGNMNESNRIRKEHEYKND